MRNMLAVGVAFTIASTAVAGACAADEPVAERAAAAAETKKEFMPPDGWRQKKRGQFTVYCRKDYNVKGTRFPAETCYDEAGIRAMVEAQREDQAMVDKMRRICGSDGGCAR
jgi:hypothetical protein